jgi:hypothetical protein
MKGKQTIGSSQNLMFHDIVKMANTLTPCFINVTMSAEYSVYLGDLILS